MIVVGAIVAATISMSDKASAAPHRHLYIHTSGFAAHLPHRSFARTDFRFARPVWRHVAAAPGWHFARRAHVAWQQAPAQIVAATPRDSHGWHRVAMRRRVALAYQTVPFAGLASLPVPSGLLPSLLPTGAVPTAAAPSATPTVATATVDRGGVRRRVAMRRRAALAYNAVPAPAGLMPFATREPVATASAAPGQMGRASFYGGRGLTAAGGHVGAATCAHRSLPFGTRVLVTNLANARSAVLTVNDRGPFVRGRIVDVSVGAAGALGMLHSGTAPVRVQVVSR